MARAASVSLSKFTETVQAAVKAAVQKHPKFQIDPPNQLALGYLIRGIPVPDALAAQMTMEETRAFATDVATQIGRGMPQLVEQGRVEGAIYSHGDHLIIGIPAITDILLER